MTKYIFVTGGVVSGLGKGITAASLGRLLKMRGLRVGAQKLDPYMNVDPGTMSPYQHGEVFVTEDGAETDLDLGHYERFIDENLTKYSNLTSGKVYWSVLNKERVGGYLGETVQIIPHITNEIKEFIYSGAKSTNADILITEIGGTTGDIESQSFLEAIRQVSLEVGEHNCLFIHVTLVPFLKGSNEHKSKPTQHSVKELRAMGISPDIIIARADEPFDSGIKNKISLFCNVKSDCVIENITIPCLYEVPLVLNSHGFDAVVCRELSLYCNEPDMKAWQDMVKKIKSSVENVKIAIVGKYTKLQDTYISIIESLNHSGYECNYNIKFVWIESSELEDNNVGDSLNNVHGVLIPGGFGDRGIEGKVIATKYAREKNIPLFGICLGMQIMSVEFARSICGYHDANSAEFDSCSSSKVIDLMETQQNVKAKGATMRLGAYPCKVKEGTILYKAYGKDLVSERHRHRYEFNNKYREEFAKKGIVFSGTSPDDSLVEAIELSSNDFHVGVQFHPEFLSRPNRPHPVFLEFVKNAIKRKDKNNA
jgi:CTP synthase